MNRYLSELLQVPERNYIGDARDAKSLIPRDWTYTATETAPGKFIVALSDGRRTAMQFHTGTALPIAICQAVLISKSRKFYGG
jgi:hypothetical protein